jgi:hypothetical protein
MKNITVEEYEELIQVKNQIEELKRTVFRDELDLSEITLLRRTISFISEDNDALSKDNKALQNKLDKIKEYCEGYIEKEDSYYGTIYAVKSEFHEILQIIESESE